MAFTPVVVTGTYLETGTGTPREGRVTFLATAPMRQASINQTIAPTEVTATLSASGSFSVTLYATNDTDTEPKGVTYEVTERIKGAALNKYFISIDSNAIAGTVDLADLVPNIDPVVEINYATVEYVNDAFDGAAVAASIVFTPTSEITSTNVQNAIEEVRSRSRYVHDQPTSSSTWSITHNMKFYPNVSIVDTALSKVVGEVTYLSENALTVTFSHSFAGKAYLS
jgi:hypothetical protein